jgi:hypothetical protein
MKTKTKIKSGGRPECPFCENHNQTLRRLRVRTKIKAGPNGPNW